MFFACIRYCAKSSPQSCESFTLMKNNGIRNRPQTENGLLFKTEDPAYAIEAYPVGLPLLIAPIYYFAKQNILPYCIFFSFILFITGIFIFEYFRKKTSLIFSFFISLIFCYNIQILELKKQILSEIPFTSILMLFFVWFESVSYQKRYAFIVTAILLSFLISLRLVGIAVILGFIIYSLNQIRIGINQKENLIKLILTAVCTFLFFIFLNKLLFPIGPGNLVNFYFTSFPKNGKIYFETE